MDAFYESVLTCSIHSVCNPYFYNLKLTCVILFILSDAFILLACTPVRDQARREKASCAHAPATCKCKGS